MRSFAPLLLAFIAAGCVTSSQALADRLIGRWEMKQIIRDKIGDVTTQQNPELNRYYVLNRDKSYESGGEPYGTQTGTWSFEISSNTLFMDSDAGEDTDSYWIVTLDDEQMLWEGTQFDFNSWFEITFERSDP